MIKSKTKPSMKNISCPHNYKGLWCPECTTLPDEQSTDCTCYCHCRHEGNHYSPWDHKDECEHCQPTPPVSSDEEVCKLHDRSIHGDDLPEGVYCNHCVSSEGKSYFDLSAKEKIEIIQKAARESSIAMQSPELSSLGKQIKECTCCKWALKWGDGSHCPHCQIKSPVSSDNWQERFDKKFKCNCASGTCTDMEDEVNANDIKAFVKDILAEQKKGIREKLLARMPNDEEVNFEENNEPAIRKGILMDTLKLLSED